MAAFLSLPHPLIHRLPYTSTSSTFPPTPQFAMAKKKAADNASKKTLQKKKEQLVEDKTFGLKNKNKSKKVQQHIKSVERNVMNSGDPKMRKLEEQRRQAKADQKARKKAAEDERNALFNEALMAVSKKTTTNMKDGKSAAAAQGRDANDETEKKSTSRAMKMMFQMDAKEMHEKLREDPNYVPTLEDELEAQRQAKVAEFKAKGIAGTPVTPETFQAWQDRKRLKRQAEAKKKVEAEFKKKKGGKGLAVLTGRALYEYKQDLFADRDDDEDAVTDVADKVQSDLFLQGEDDDLDDLDDD